MAMREASGKAMGEAEALVNNIRTLMKNLNKSLDEVLAILNVSKTQYENCLVLL